MADRDRNRRENDARQSSETDKALGQDERAFGAGGQRTQGPLSSDDRTSRKTGRDPTVPGRQPEETASRH